MGLIQAEKKHMPQSRSVINLGEKGLREIAGNAVAWNSKVTQSKIFF